MAKKIVITKGKKSPKGRKKKPTKKTPTPASPSSPPSGPLKPKSITLDSATLKDIDSEPLPPSSSDPKPKEPQPDSEPPPESQSDATITTPGEANLFRFFCIRCGQKLKVLRSSAGVRKPCPSCKYVITIPKPFDE